MNNFSTLRPARFCLVLLILLLAAAGCATIEENGGAADDATPTPADNEDADSNGPDDLLGPEWHLVEINGEPALEGTAVTLRFRDDGQLGGNDGCNDYGGTYSIEGDVLSVPEIASNDMACGDPEGVMEQASAYHEILMQDGIRYQVEGAQLRITDTDGDTLVAFTARESFDVSLGDLDGTDWTLTRLAGEEILPDSQLTIAFDDGEFHGYAGCRSFEGTYLGEGDQIRFTSMGMTSFECLRADQYRLQESVYIDLLGQLSYFNVTDDALALYTQRDERLSYEPMTDEADHEPADATWVLDHFVLDGETVEPDPDVDITVAFENGVIAAEGRISGSGGCNTFHAGYTLDADTLVFDSIPITEMGCVEPEGVMEQEQQYVDLIRQNVTYMIENGELRLTTADSGDELVYVPESG